MPDCQKDNPGFREQTIQGKLGRHSTSVGIDVKKVKAAFSLHAFI